MDMGGATEVQMKDFLIFSTRLPLMLCGYCIRASRYIRTYRLDGVTAFKLSLSYTCTYTCNSTGHRLVALVEVFIKTSSE